MMGEPAAISTVVSGEVVRRPEETAVDRLRGRLERIADDDARVVRDMSRFAELPTIFEKDGRKRLSELLAGDEQAIKDAGWRSRKQLRTALYATLPKKDWPAAMQAAHERTLARIRREAKPKAQNVFNLNMINIPAPRRQTEDDRVVVIAPGEKR